MTQRRKAHALLGDLMVLMRNILKGVEACRARMTWMMRRFGASALGLFEWSAAPERTILQIVLGGVRLTRRLVMIDESTMAREAATDQSPCFVQVFVSVESGGLQGVC